MLIFVLQLLFSCKKNSTSTPDNPVDNREIIVNDSAIVINSSTSNLITMIDSSKIIFNGASSQLDSIKVGYIIVSKPTTIAKFGFLRKVLMISKSGTITTAITENAKLTDLFDKANASYEYEYEIADTMARILINPFLINDSIVLNNTNGQAKILIDFKSNPKLRNDFNIKLSNGNNFTFPELQSWLCRFDLNNELAIKATANYNGPFALGPRKIGNKKTLKNFYFNVGGVPINLKAEIEWFIGLQGTFVSNAELVYTNSNTSYGQFTYTGSSWFTNSDFNTLSNQFSTVVNANGTIKAYVQPSVSISVYDHSVVGVGLNPNIYAKLNSNFNITSSTTNLNWELFAGIDGNGFLTSDLLKYIGLADQTRKDFPNIFNKEFLIKKDSIIYNLNTGLAAYYPMNLSVNDASGNSNNGTVVGSVQPAVNRKGEANKALDFGNLGFISIPSSSSLNFSNKSSWSFWINLNSNVDNWAQSIFTKDRDDQGKINAFAAKNASNQIITWSSFITSSTTVIPSSSVNQWTHLVYIFDESNNRIKIYANGQLIRDEATSVISHNSANNKTLYIASNNGGIHSFNGKIDDFRIYNRLLSLAEIQALFAE
jgi:hypothetical protein